MLAPKTSRFPHVENRILQDILPQIEFARNRVMGTLLPSFDSIAAEADRVASEAYESYMHAPGDGSDDGSGAADRAEGDGQEFYSLAFGFKQGFLNLLFVHLYHLIEQHLASLVRSERPDGKFEYSNSVDLYQRVFETFGFDITLFDTWKSIEELRWMANTVNHAEAKDAERLHERRPQLFVYPGTPQELANHPLWNRTSGTELPMVGEHFYPQAEEYESKVREVLAFWMEFRAVLKGEKRVKTLTDWVGERRAEILAVVQARGASNVRVFGSVARGEAGPASDVDFLVGFKKDTSFGTELDLIEKLEELLGRKVDLGTFESLKPRLKERAMREAIPRRGIPSSGSKTSSRRFQTSNGMRRMTRASLERIHTLKRGCSDKSKISERR